MFGFIKNKIVKSEGRGQGELWPIVLENFEHQSIIDLINSIYHNGKPYLGKIYSVRKNNDICVVVNRAEQILTCYFDPNMFYQNGEASNLVVYEWPSKVEADIKATIKGVSLVFFATDYALKKRDYQLEKIVSIELAGLCSVFSEFNIEQVNKESELKYDDSFTCIMPTEHTSFYSIVFDVIKVTKSKLTDGKEFWIVDANLTTTENPLVATLYIPVSAGQILQGKKYTAPLLLLGRITKK
jgi:hypothetical protein